MKNIILLLFFTVTAFAAAPKKFTGDVLQFGGGANGSLKELIINSGGASNPSIQAASGDGSLLLRTDALSVGNGTATNKDFTFDVGLGASNPKLFWDNTAQAISFSNDGTLVKKIGSGSGGGGGENFNNAFLSSQNANAEDGLVQWSNVGTGTFSLDTADALEGDQSFSFASSAQNDYVQGPLLNMSRDVLKGRACQARIEYVGGDSTLELRLVDASGALFKSLPLKAHALSAAEYLFFLCPSAADITADANLAQLRLQIYNAGATAAPLIKFDKSYVGTLIGLSETTLPDVFSATLNGGTGALLSSAGGIVTGCGTTTTGVYYCNFSGLTVAPSCTVSSLLQGDTNRAYQIDTLSSSIIYVRTYVLNATAAAVSSLSITCQKQGVDAKQSVQVYKSIPKVSENVNTLSAICDINAIACSNENVPWIQSASRPGNGHIALSIIPGIFSVFPNVNVTINNSSADLGCVYANNGSPSVIDVYCTNGAGSAINGAFSITVSKGPQDFKLPTVQPIIVGQVSNSYAKANSKNVRVESCQILNNGTFAATSTANGFCNSWISSVTRNTVGQVDLVVKNNIFKDQSTNQAVNCIATYQDSASPTNVAFSLNVFFITNTIRVSYRDYNGNAVDNPFTIVCIGDK